MLQCMRNMAKERNHKKELHKTYLTNCRCPRCGHQLLTSDIDGYSFMCPECDENYLTVEAVYGEDGFAIYVDCCEEKFATLKDKLGIIQSEMITYDLINQLLILEWKKDPGCNVILEAVIRLENFGFDSWDADRIRQFVLSEGFLDGKYRKSEYRYLLQKVVEPEYLEDNVSIGCSIGRCSCGTVVHSYDNYCSSCGVKLIW